MNISSLYLLLGLNDNSSAKQDLLNCVCALQAIIETGIAYVHRRSILAVEIRNCWNADSVCLQ